MHFKEFRKRIRLGRIRIIISLALLFAFFGFYKFALAIHKLPDICERTFPWDDLSEPFMTFRFPCKLDGFFTIDKLREFVGGGDSAKGHVATHTSKPRRSKIYYDLLGYAESKMFNESCLGGTVITTRDWTTLEPYSQPKIQENSDCPPLDSVMQLCVAGQCNVGDPKGDAFVSERGSFTLDWKAGLRTTKLLESCSITGSSNDKAIWQGNADAEGRIVGNFTFAQVSRGIHRYDLDCSGIFDASKSSAAGNFTKTAYVNVGNVKSPDIISFEADKTEIIEGEGTPVKLSIKIGNPQDLAEVRIGSGKNDSQSVPIINGVGSIIVSPVQTTSYVAVAISKWQGLETSYSSAIKVKVEIPPAPEVAFCKTEPASIKAGQDAEINLSWEIKNPSEVESFYVSSSVQGISGLSDFKEKSGSKKLFIPGSVRDDIELTFFSKSIRKKWGTVSQPCAMIKVEYPSKPKIISFKATPERIKLGGSADLEWNAENAQSVIIDQGVGPGIVKGSAKVFPKFTTVYTLTASGAIKEAGTAKAQAIVRVEAPELPVIPPEPSIIPPDIEGPFAVSPSEEPQGKLAIDLKVNGQDRDLIMAAPASFTLSWNLDKYCLAYGSWLGIKTKAGQERIIKTKPGIYTFNINCPTIGSDEVAVKVVGSGGSGVSVGRGAPAVFLPVAEASISANGKFFSNSVRVRRGEPTELWLSAGYDVNQDRSASRDDTGKWTSAMSNGGQCQWNYDLNQGSPIFEAFTNDPQTSKDCTINLGKLIFYDKPGSYRYGVLRLIQNDNKVSNVGYVNVVVQEPPPPKTPPVIDLRINDQEGPNIALGAPAQYAVSWKVSNADTCEALDSWGGDKFLIGSENFVSSEKKEFIYTLSCTGKLGTTIKSVNLKVAELPICDFSAQPLVLNKKSVFDQQAVLNWKCRFANSCFISPDIGVKVGIFGSARVSPKITTSYTLNCLNFEGNASFNQAVEIR